MKLVNQSVELLEAIDGVQLLKNIELYGRTAYKSENLITEDSYIKFVTNVVLTKKHLSIIEHEKVTVKITTSRAIANEIVRHRIGSYTQSSTRYCNYSKSKFEDGILCVIPSWFNNFEKSNNKQDAFNSLMWIDGLKNAEKLYLELIAHGLKAQEARGILPLDLQTEIIVTYNLRSWLHFFDMRCSKEAHPDMQILAKLALKLFYNNIPLLFDELAKQYL